MPTHHTACPLDCPDACSLAVEVEEDRVVRVRGDHRNPLTRGAICAKVAASPAHLYGPERLTRPLRRIGPKGAGTFAPIGWDEALDLAAAQIRAAAERSGPEAVLPCSYGGSNGYLTEGSFDARFFGRLGATRLDRTLCAQPTSAAHTGLYGRMPGGALQDIAESRLIIMWGCNPHASGIHLLPPIQRARRAGAQLVVIDPTRTPLAQKADLHLAPRPGTDVALALALHRLLFETGAADLAFLRAHATGWERLRARAAPWTLEAAEAVTGVPATQIARLAELYVAASPAMIRCGYGMERNRNGGSGAAAILALPAVAGKFGVRGGGFLMSSSGAWSSFDPARAADAPDADSRVVNLSQLGAALTELSDPPIEVLFVYNCNPLTTLPDQEAVRRGLLREDLFTVVHEVVMTDTARYADLVLPATFFLEHDDLHKGYGALTLNRLRPTAPPHGEARCNADVFNALSDRLGLSAPGDARTPAALAERIVAASPDSARLSRELSERGRAAAPCGEAPVAFKDLFPSTPDQKIHLCPPALDAEAPMGLYGFQPEPGGAPLALISPAIASQISSTFGQLREAPARLQMHPADAAPRGLVDGQRVRIHNTLGEVVCGLEITDRIRPGVVSLPKGIWSRHTENGRGSNALVPQTLTDLGGGPCFNDARVEVEAAQ